MSRQKQGNMDLDSGERRAAKNGAPFKGQWETVYGSLSDRGKKGNGEGEKREERRREEILASAGRGGYFLERSEANRSQGEAGGKKTDGRECVRIEDV